MPQTLPFIPSEPFYGFSTVLDGITVEFNVRWNARDEAWYFDLFDEDGAPIAHGIKIVLGAYLGRRVNHSIFRLGVLVAIDTSGERRDATLDDLGTRVIVRHLTEFEVAAGILAASAEAAG